MSFLWHFAEMAAWRDEYWNGGFILPEAKRRKNSGALAHDTALMSLLETIDNMDSNGSNLAGDLTDVGINGVVNSLEDEIQLKVQTDHNIEKGSSAEMASIKQLGQGQITADQGTTEATMVTPDIWDFTYYDDVGAELGFLIDLIASRELGIMINGIHGHSMFHNMYSDDAVYGYAETTELFYGSLWEDDIWHLNEHPVIQNDFSSPQHEEFGITGGIEFHDVGNYSKPIQPVSDCED